MRTKHLKTKNGQTEYLIHKISNCKQDTKKSVVYSYCMYIYIWSAVCCFNSFICKKKIVFILALIFIFKHRNKFNGICKRKTDLKTKA